MPGGGVQRAAARGDAGEQCVRPCDFGWAVDRYCHIHCLSGVFLRPGQVPGAIALLGGETEEVRGEEAGVDAGQLVDRREERHVVGAQPRECTGRLRVLSLAATVAEQGGEWV